MEQGLYIRIIKTVISVGHSGSATRPATIYEFYFTSISKCAQWLGVSYNAVKYCLRGDYTLCEGYRMEYVKVNVNDEQSNQTGTPQRIKPVNRLHSGRVRHLWPMDSHVMPKDATKVVRFSETCKSLRKNFSKFSTLFCHSSD